MFTATRARLLFAVASCCGLVAQEPEPAGSDVGWMRPGKVIENLVTAPPPPSASLSPQGTMLVLVTREAMPDLEVLARPHLKLAGMRIDGGTRSRQLTTATTDIVLQPLIGSGDAHRVPIRPGHCSAPIWSADDRAFALVRYTDGGGELWVADPCTAAPRQIPGVRVNEVLGRGVQWMPDQQRLLVSAVVPGDAPTRPAVPAGPVVQETMRGVEAQVRTYQDLLQDAHDADLLEHYGTSRMTIVDPRDGTVAAIGEPAMFADVQPSPDGSLLLAEVVQRPFSYLVPIYRFPRRTVVLDLDGKVRREVHTSRLGDTIPIGGVAKGPRSVAWLPVAPHTLYWLEALDGGDPDRDVPHRDQVFLLLEPEATPAMWFRSELRVAGVRCCGDGRHVLTGAVDRRTHVERVWLRDLQQLAEPGRMLYERSTQDAYGDPGDPVSETLPDGRDVLRMADGTLFRSGDGASPDGSRPFLDRWDPIGGEVERLFTSAEGRYERFVGFVGTASDRREIVVRSESGSEPPRLLRVDLESGDRTVLHEDSDPAADWIGKIQKRLVRYEREDGVPMSGTLYLPPSYRDGDHLPCLLWAYPREYVKASDAGQVRQAPDRYLRLSGSSHLFLLLEGYAVFDNASMPIVGPRDSANDTFVEQVRMNARAAVNALQEQGCIDPQRIAVAGHSYGAFMTANLLAHSDLFCCGIARSGAYNRTLTPFGFQNEERTYWQAPDVYFSMSPFMHADKVDEPILLLHGSDDNNSGTFPMQSRRFFSALKGHGATARLCFLPHESHGYRGRQSVLHCLAEMIQWLDTHCKGEGGR